MEGATAGSPAAPFRFQGVFFALSLWTAFLFTADIFTDGNERRHLWAPVYAAHAAAAALTCLATLQEEDLQGLPLVERLAPLALSWQGGLARACPALRARVLCTAVVLYFGVSAWWRLTTSSFRHIWLALVILHVPVHVANFACILAGLCLGRAPGGSTESAAKKDE